MRKIFLLLLVKGCTGVVAEASPTNSAARIWDEGILSPVPIDPPIPLPLFPHESRIQLSLIKPDQAELNLIKPKFFSAMLSRP